VAPEAVVEEVPVLQEAAEVEEGQSLTVLD